MQATNSNVRSLRNYIRPFRGSTYDVVEFEVLPEVINDSLVRFSDDIDVIKAPLPSKAAVWFAFNKRVVNPATVRLNEHKADAALAVPIAEG